jgi:hypothetical protein
MTTAQIREKIDQAVNAAREQAQAQLHQTQTQLDKTQRELNDLRVKDFEDKTELEGIEQSEIDEAVAKATAPLQKQIEKFQQKLERSER